MDDLISSLANIVQVSDIGFESRTNSVSQAFERNLAEASYRIQRQQLHREDIRDLMELTVGRMDLYHVVGTLLLTFCISWYTENGIVSSPLPKWFATLFLISNFCAVGYLIFSVWLAMHASIIAHSVGVRLLTSFARLSIPSKAELDSMRTSIYPFLQTFLDLGARLLSSAPAGAAGGDAPARTPSRKQSEAWRSRRGSSFDAADQKSSAAVGEASANAGDDDTEHFLRFLQEQRRWLSYDAYARVCMTLGMNQMLQALAYYTQGVLWNSSPVAANTSFFAIEFLGLLLMKLDIAVDDNAGILDALALVLFYLTPPVLASALMWTHFAIPDTLHSGVLSICATVCFALHAGWMLYVLHSLGWHSQGDGKQSAVLPPRFRVVQYLSVVEAQQRRIASAVHVDRAQAQAHRAAEARRTLEDMMLEVMAREAESDAVGVSDRQNDELMAAQASLAGHVEQLRSAGVAAGDHEAMEELRRCERAVDRFAVWAQAPEVLATLEALRAAPRQGSAHEACQRLVEAKYQAFLQQCEDLDLGICAPAPENPPGDGLEERSPFEEELEMKKARSVREEDQVDAVAAGWLSFPPSVYGEPAGGAQGAEQPGPERQFLRQRSFEARVTDWSAAARYVHQARAAEFEDGGDCSPIHSRSAKNFAAQLPEHGEASEDPPAAPVPDLIPKHAMPPEPLPGQLFRWLTLGIALWWLAAGLIHIGGVLVETDFMQHPMANWTYAPEGDGVAQHRRSTDVQVDWPPPAGFFRVRSVHCDRTSVWLGTRFALYQAPRRQGHRLGDLVELGDAAAAAAICGGDAGGCSTLRRPPSAAAWRLSPPAAAGLRGGAGADAAAEAVPVPPAWRALSGAWGPGGAAGREGVVAAWDGAAVLVASLRQEAGRWAVAARYEVDPRQARCEEGPGLQRCQECRRSGYSDVLALQLSGDRRTLAVLHAGGFLDGWDLTSNTLLGRWDAGGNFSAMCHDGEEMLLVRQDASGPRLEAAPLPAALRPSQHRPAGAPRARRGAAAGAGATEVARAEADGPVEHAEASLLQVRGLRARPRGGRSAPAAGELRPE